MTSPAVTCLVTIPHKVLMSHKKNEFFKVLTAWCSLSTLGLIGYSEIFLTLSQLLKLENILIDSTLSIISLLPFKELNNLLLFLHHNLDIFQFTSAFVNLTHMLQMICMPFKELNNLSIILHHNLKNYSLLHLQNHMLEMILITELLILLL